MATVEELYDLYGGKVKLRFLPNSHRYSIDGDRKLGVTTVTGVINKEALMMWPMQEALSYLKNEIITKTHKGGANEVVGTVDKFQELLDNAALAFRKKQDRGTDAGTFGHEWLEQYLRATKDGKKLPARIEKINIDETFGSEPDKDSDEYIRATDHNNIVDAIDSLLAWLYTNKVEVLEVEKICYSIEYDYCGKFDAILKVDGKVYLVDFKTSNPAREFPHGIYPENYAQLGGYDIAFTEEFPDFHIDGHMIINLSKKSGKMSIESVEGEVERQQNREFFLFALGTKRGMQNRTRLLSYRNKDRTKRGAK